MAKGGPSRKGKPESRRLIRTLKDGMFKHIKPKDHVLVIGPGYAFVDPTPLLAAHITGKKGRVTILDSQMWLGGEEATIVWT